MENVDSEVEEGEIQSPKRTLEVNDCYDIRNNSSQATRKKKHKHYKHRRKRRHYDHMNDFDVARKKLLMQLNRHQSSRQEHCLELVASDIMEVEMKDATEEIVMLESDDEDLRQLRESALHSQKSSSGTVVAVIDDLVENEFHLRAEALKTALLKKRTNIKLKKKICKNENLQVSLDNRENVDVNRLINEIDEPPKRVTEEKIVNSESDIIDAVEDADNLDEKTSNTRKMSGCSASSSPKDILILSPPVTVAEVNRHLPQESDNACDVDDEVELRLLLLNDLISKSSPKNQASAVVPKESVDVAITKKMNEISTEKLETFSSCVQLTVKKPKIFPNSPMIPPTAIVLRANKLVKKSLAINKNNAKRVVGSRKLINNQFDILNKHKIMKSTRGRLNNPVASLRSSVPVLQPMAVQSAMPAVSRPSSIGINKQERFVIRLGDDSSDEESTHPVKDDDPIGLRIDEFLQGARQRSEEEKKVPSSFVVPSTPEAVYAHLPPSQKLEYIRLKKKLAEREEMKVQKLSANKNTSSMCVVKTTNDSNQEAKFSNTTEADKVPEAGLENIEKGKPTDDTESPPDEKTDIMKVTEVIVNKVEEKEMNNVESFVPKPSTSKIEPVAIKSNVAQPPLDISSPSSPKKVPSTCLPSKKINKPVISTSAKPSSSKVDTPEMCSKDISKLNSQPIRFIHYSKLLDLEIQRDLLTRKEIDRLKQRTVKLERKSQTHKTTIKHLRAVLLKMLKKMTISGSPSSKMKSNGDSKVPFHRERKRSLTHQGSLLSYSSPLNSVDCVGVDPNVEFCPHYLAGICRDPECPYQHPAGDIGIRNSSS